MNAFDHSPWPTGTSSPTSAPTRERTNSAIRRKSNPNTLALCSVLLSMEPQTPQQPREIRGVALLGLTGAISPQNEEFWQSQTCGLAPQGLLAKNEGIWQSQACGLA